MTIAEMLVDTDERKLQIVYEIKNERNDKFVVQYLVNMFIEDKTTIQIWRDDYDHRVVNVYGVEVRSIKNIVHMLEKNKYDVKFICNSWEDIETVRRQLSRKLE